MDSIRQTIADPLARHRVGWRRSLRTRLVVMSSLSSALLMVMVSVIFYLAIRDLLIDNARSEMRGLARQTALGLEATLDSVQVSGRTLAASASSVGRQPFNLRALLTATVTSDPDIFGATLVIEPERLAPDDPGFTWRVRRTDAGLEESTFQPLADEDRDMPRYMRMKMTGVPWWSEPYANEATGSTIYTTYNLPLWLPGDEGRPGAAIGMVSVDVPVERLGELLAQIPRSEFLRPAILSPERMRLLRPADRIEVQVSLDMLVETGGRTDLRPLLEAVRERRQVELDHVIAVASRGSPQGERRYTYALPVADTGWTFVLSASENYVVTQLNRIILWVVLAGLVGVLVAMLLVRRTSRLIAEPIEDLTESARHFAVGEFDYPLGHVDREDEVGVMARAFDSARASIKQQMEEIAALGAMQSRLDGELNIAREIQLAMLPGDNEFDAGDAHVEFCGLLEPAKTVGGDFYNLFERDGDSVWFVIGDVSDKGVPAALFMTRTMTVLEVAAQLGGSPGRALHEAAKHLVEGNETCMFATVLCGVVELRTGVLTLASAAHEAPVLLRADGRREFLPVETEGPLGVDVAEVYPVWRGRLLPGDTLFTYTDGITEAFDADDQPFGEQRLLDALDPSLDARAQCQRVVAAARAFVGDAPQSDDITVFALQFRRDAPGREPFAVTCSMRPPIGADAVRRLIAEVDAGLAGHALPATVVHDLHLVIEEVTVNILSHGHDEGREPSLDFLLTVEGERLAMTFRDDGRPFDPLAQPAPDLDADIGDRPIGGLGVHLIRELAEEVAYTRDDGANVLRVVLHIPPTEPRA